MLTHTGHTLVMSILLKNSRHIVSTGGLPELLVEDAFDFGLELLTLDIQVAVGVDESGSTVGVLSECCLPTGSVFLLR